VLKHLDRDDAVELHLRIESIDVRRDYPEIGQAAPGSFVLNIFTLRRPDRGPAALRFAGAAGEAVYKMIMHYPDGFG
jgi:hypothetical protein